MDTCKTNVGVSLVRANLRESFVSGHDFSRAEKAGATTGFSRCGPVFLLSSASGSFALVYIRAPGDEVIY
jgi:hypothetical protein